MPSARVIVELPGRPDCTVRIGQGLLPKVGPDIAEQHPDVGRAVLLADAKSGQLYRPAVKASLSQAGFRVLDITVPDGRQARSSACVEELWAALAQSGVSTHTVVVALGGLSACIAGLYTAAGYRGGMCAALVPTTVEAMTVSATLPSASIDLPAVRGAVTRVPMPTYACLSLDTVKAASQPERFAGAAEIVRAALFGIHDELFRLEDLVADIAHAEGEGLASALALANIARADALALVPAEPPATADEHGFSYGSALGEAAISCGFDADGLQGRLLADGMRFEARLGVACGVTPIELMREQDSLLAGLGLAPVPDLPEPSDLAGAISELPGQPQTTVRLALPVDAGAFAPVDIDPDLVLEHLQARASSL